MSHLINRYGGKTTILAGLLMQAVQLLLLGFFKRPWMMWISGVIASFSSITYPAISAYISSYADADKQGLVQGLITGVRSLCGGIGPAMFGLLFNIFDVDVYEGIKANPLGPHTAQDVLKPFIDAEISSSDTHSHDHHLHPPQSSLLNNGASTGVSIKPPTSVLNPTTIGAHKTSGVLASWIVGPPFLFGAILVLLAAIAATFIPDTIMPYKRRDQSRTTTSEDVSATYYRYTTVDSDNNLENGVITVSHGNGRDIDASHCELLDDIDDED